MIGGHGGREIRREITGCLLRSHQVIVDVGGHAKFKDKCCHIDRITGQFVCTTDIGNIWLSMLYTLLGLVRIGMLLFGPVLFVESVERLGQVRPEWVEREGEREGD